MKKIHKEMPMKECLRLMFRSNNIIISSDGLASNEFIFVYGCKAYYEDGGCLGSFTKTMDILDSQEWTHTHKWYIAGILNNDEVEAINDMMRRHLYYNTLCIEDKLKTILNTREVDL